MPRHQEAYFNDLGFTFIREDNAYKACCVLCNKKLTNTGMRRLQSHRNYCTVNGILPIRKKNRTLESENEENALAKMIEDISSHPAPSSVVLDLDDNSIDLVNIEVPEEETATMCILEPQVDLSTSTLPSLTAAGDGSSGQVVAHSTKSSAANAQSAKRQSLTRQAEAKLLDEKLSDFFFGCDIPLAVVESVQFRSLIAALRPWYASKLPTRHRLATQLLDAGCERCVADGLRWLRGQPSVLVVDEWLRGEYGPSNVLVALLQNAGAGDERLFLRARHATDDEDDDDFYAAFVADSLTAAHQAYETSVYAVVGDRVDDKSNAEAPDAIWYSPCYLGLANALARDIFDQELDEKVTFVLRQFQRATWHRALLAAGGQPVPLPRCNSWRSYHQSYVNLAQNAASMKAVIDDDAAFESGADCASQRKLTQELLGNGHFLASVTEQASALEPICQLIETCGRSDAFLADAAHAWIEVRIYANDRFRQMFERRRNAALTKYALTAYFLHPKRAYYERSTAMACATDGQQKAHFLAAQSFLLERLDADGIAAFDQFQNGLGIAKTLLAKNVEDATVFWRTVKPHHPQLADLALRLLRIPASASRVDRQFYRRSYAHDALAAADDSSPAFERCEKLLRIYYSRRSADVASPEF